MRFSDEGRERKMVSLRAHLRLKKNSWTGRSQFAVQTRHPEIFWKRAELHLPEFRILMNIYYLLLMMVILEPTFFTTGSIVIHGNSL